MTTPLRCGDLAYVAPSGPVRRVAFVNQDTGRIALDGPLDGMHEPDTVMVIRQWSYWEHHRCVRLWHDGDPSDPRRRSIMFIYRHTLENPPHEPRFVDDAPIQETTP